MEFAALNLTIRQTEPKKILGPLGWVFRGLFWGVEKLFVIRDPDSEPGALPAYAPASAVPPPPASSGPADMLRYSVQEGDSLEIISRLFVLSPDDIRRANPALEGREVSPGEILFIPPSSP